jgi:hypothetical protein
MVVICVPLIMVPNTWQQLGHFPRLTDLLGGVLVNGPTRGLWALPWYPVPGYSTAAPEPMCDSLESVGGFLARG